MHSKKLRFMALTMLIAIIVSQMSLAAPMTTNQSTMPKPYSTGVHGKNEVPPGKSPTTGLDFAGEYRPVLVQIDNTEGGARPHLNMSEADIVYESIYWGPAYTRYTFIYNDNHPDLVGSVRSARWHHMELREEWDAPMIFWGGQRESGTSIDDYIKDHNVPSSFLVDPTAPKGNPAVNDVTSRINSRTNPHDAIANLDKFVASYWPTDEGTGAPYTPRSHAFKFSSSPSRGVDTAVEVDIKYDNEGHFHPVYTFNSQTRQYERWYDGKEQFDGITEKRIVASNVIVQYADIRYQNNIASRPIVTTVGSGVMHAFIDGQHIEGTWERKQEKDRTVFLDIAGNEITLLPGKTFVQIIPLYQQFTYKTDGGETKTVEFGAPVSIPKVEDDVSEMNKVEGMD